MQTSSTLEQLHSTRFNYWSTCCGQVPRDQVVFLFQVVIAYIVIIASLVKITFSSENLCSWATLASGTIGYLLPSPSIDHVQILRRTSV
jgi:hypothetical protein